MMTPATRLDFGDLGESLPAFVVVVLMSFTYNIGIGMTAGLIVYPVLKLLTGRAREVKPGLWALAALSVLFFVFYPY
jgi:AGZA family xanthine/uracil permease-like MFS transporter